MMEGAESKATRSIASASEQQKYLDNLAASVTQEETQPMERITKALEVVTLFNYLKKDTLYYNK
jgi:hypothetical protein